MSPWRNIYAYGRSTKRVSRSEHDYLSTAAKRQSSCSASAEVFALSRRLWQNFVTPYFQRLRWFFCCLWIPRWKKGQIHFCRKLFMIWSVNIMILFFFFGPLNCFLLIKSPEFGPSFPKSARLLLHVSGSIYCSPIVLVLYSPFIRERFCLLVCFLVLGE